MTVLPEVDVNRIDFTNLAEAILSHGHVLQFRARGLSMRPFVRDGDILEVSPWRREAINPGDILLYRTREGRIFVHRVVGIRREADQIAYVLQGDALVFPDGLVFSDQVLGRVVRVSRGRHARRLDTLRQRLFAMLWVYAANLLKFILRLGVAGKRFLVRNR